MYGYIVPNVAKMSDSEYILYRAFYCGLCLDISRRFGQLPRFATNYDFTFLAILISDFLTFDVEIARSKCITSMGRERVIITQNQLLTRLNDANILLAMYKIRDDIADGGRLSSRIASLAMRKAYARAKASSPDIDQMCTSHLDALGKLERSGANGLDYLSHCFASLTSDLAKLICGQKMNDIFGSLCYNLGKYIYLIDALDDVDKDMKRGDYNVWVATLGRAEGRQQFFASHADDIDFAMNTVINRTIESFNSLKWTQSYNVLQNVIHGGLRAKLAEILASPKTVGKKVANQQMRRKSAKPVPPSDGDRTQSPDTIGEEG